MTLVQVGDCWRYALEAIINIVIIIYLCVYDKCLHSCYNSINKETINTCVNCKLNLKSLV